MAIATTAITVQPAKAVLALRRLTVRSVAAQIGMNELTVGRMLNGLDRPTPRFRAGLAALLEVPEHELFRAVDGS